MWPFGDEEIIQNNLTAHDVVSYSMDGAFVAALVIAVLVYRWRRNTNRLRQLERNVKRRELDGVHSV